MSYKLLASTICLGLLINILLIIVPNSVQVSYSESFERVDVSDFTPGSQQLCEGVNFPVRQSVRSIGYPLRSKTTVNYDDCTSTENVRDRLNFLGTSVTLVNFCANWLFWSGVVFAVAFAALKLFTSYTSKRVSKERV